MYAEISFKDQVNGIITALDTNLHQTHDVINTLERKAQANFTVISAIAVAVVLVNVNFIDVNNLELGGKCALLVFAGAYLIVATLSILTLWPRVIDLCPLEPTKSNIADMLDRTDENSFYFELMEQYSRIYDSHMCVIKVKRQHVMCSYRLVATAIIAVIVEILVYAL